MALCDIRMHNSELGNLYITNSQSEKNLAYLADQYIVETIGRVQVVIDVKLDDGRSLKAVLSLWRPQIVEESGRRYLESKQEISSEVRSEEPYIRLVCVWLTRVGFP